MKLVVREIKEEPERLAFSEDVTELNLMLGHGVRDYVVSPPIGVRLVYYRAGTDVFIDGDFWAHITGTCGRCLAEYPFRLARSFSLVLAPLPGPDGGGRDVELTADDLALSFYSGEEIELSPLVHEQVVLALPTRALCDPGCRGLCPQCGAPRALGPCGCAVEQGDPRLAVLRKLKVGG